MLNITHTLEHMEIPTTSVTRAIQAVGAILDGNADVCAAASKLINSLLSLDHKFTDADVARVTVLAVAEAIAKCEGVIGDEVALLEAAVERANKHMTNPRNAWMYAKDEGVTGPAETKAIEGTALNVVVKADGKIKRGGKAVVAEELFRIHVLESATPCDNKCFVDLLMKHGQFTLAGARTYAHNCRKANGTINK